MGNARVRGRPIAPVVLSAQERAYLERQVRRQRVARSLSERCRAILRCEARQAINPYKSETIIFNYCTFAIAPTTASSSPSLRKR
jgi:hypothetical protein